MYKKNIIKGGELKIVENQNKIFDHWFYDDPDDAYVRYKMAEVETEKNIDINVQKFKLYKFSELTKYGSDEIFVLPYDINNIDNINNLYLFGLYKDTRNEYFIKKMPVYNKQIFKEIAKSLNSVFKSPSFENCSIELIMVSHNDEETGLNSLFIIFVIGSNNKKKDAYKTLKESISNISTLIDYNEIKKKSTISYLNNFIIYTNEKLNITTTDNQNPIQSRNRLVVMKPPANIDIEEKEDERIVLKDVDIDENQLLHSTTNGGYNRKLKRKELNTMSLTELKQLHKISGIKMNNNRTIKALINNYIKNYK